MGYAPLAALRQELGSTSKRELVLVRLARSEMPVAAIPAQGLHRALTLFDFEGPAQIDRFVSELRPDPSVVGRSGQRLRVDESRWSPAQEEAQELIRELEDEFPF